MFTLTNSKPTVKMKRKKPGFREAVIRILRSLRLNRPAARFYYRWIHGFASAGEDLPAAIDRCFERVAASGVPAQGDYVEFGVFKGYSFFRAYKAAQSQNLTEMRFFGFDSFAGIPEVTGIDNVDDAPFYKGQFAWPLRRVRNDLSKRGIDWSKCHLIDGRFDQILNQHTREQFKIRKAAIALVDCDLYSSASAALDFLSELIVDGTILIMDDWNAFDSSNARGERRALKEFLDSNPQWRAEPWFSYGMYGQVFILHLNQ